MALDDIDRELLRLLRLDARKPNSALAQEVGLSASACLRRIKALEHNGTIRGYTVLTGGDADDEVVFIVQVTLDRQTEECLVRFETAVRSHPEIRECFLMTGASDYVLRVVAESAHAYEVIHTEVLSRLPGVARLQSSFAMRDALRPKGRPRRRA
ncbi:MAG: Lrp/AsnC family transcriptional regulator [Caulobacteraceae bacterium]